MEDVDEFLAHYGVKGMKWGVRRNRSAVEVSVKATPGRRVKARGGENQSAHEDAIRAATYKRVATKSTTDALSTKQLQEVVNRMNLEQQYNRLRPTNMSDLGKDFARKMAAENSNQAADFLTKGVDAGVNKYAGIGPRTKEAAMGISLAKKTIKGAAVVASVIAQGQKKKKK